jgi:hypothetical protein
MTNTLGGVDWTNGATLDPVQMRTLALGLESWLQSTFGNDDQTMAQFANWLQARQQSGQFTNLADMAPDQSAASSTTASAPPAGGSSAGPPPFGVDALI